jgi:hypothetical protein
MMMTEVSLDELGPVDYVVVEFPCRRTGGGTGTSPGLGDASPGWLVFGLTR